jgi:hypothetical protein
LCVLKSLGEKKHYCEKCGGTHLTFEVKELHPPPPAATPPPPPRSTSSSSSTNTSTLIKPLNLNASSIEPTNKLEEEKPITTTTHHQHYHYNLATIGKNAAYPQSNLPSATSTIKTNPTASSRYQYQQQQQQSLLNSVSSSAESLIKPSKNKENGSVIEDVYGSSEEEQRGKILDNKSNAYNTNNNNNNNSNFSSATTKVYNSFYNHKSITRKYLGHHPLPKEENLSEIQTFKSTLDRKKKIVIDGIDQRTILKHTREWSRTGHILFLEKS